MPITDLSALRKCDLEVTGYAEIVDGKMRIVVDEIFVDGSAVVPADTDLGGMVRDVMLENMAANMLRAEFERKFQHDVPCVGLPPRLFENVRYIETPDD